MRRDLIAGNWKMNATHLEAIQMVQKLSYRLNEEDFDRVDVVVCPPFTALRSAQTVIVTDHLRIILGAQHSHWADSGAHTGEISPVMLKRLSVRYVIAGHSERRAAGMSDGDVNRQVLALLEHELTPIMCVGEVREQRDAGEAESVVSAQLAASLAGLTAEQLAACVIAYEPVWAIGTGLTATPDDADAMCAMIRNELRQRWGDVADTVRILYGGSVNPGNIAALMAKRDIDGALVGGASLDPDTFAAVVRYWV